MTLLRCGGVQRARAATQYRRIEPAYVAFQPLGHGLAIVSAIGGERFAEADHGVDRSARTEGLEMRHEVEVAVPRDQRTVLAAHRDALLPGVADRHRLDLDGACA